MTQTKGKGRGRKASAQPEEQVTVRLLTGRSDGDTTWYAGDEITIGQAEAKALLERGSAEIVAKLPNDQAEAR